MDDFEIRSLWRYLNGKGYPPNCNTALKKKIGRQATYHTAIGEVLYRDEGYQPDTGLVIKGIDSRNVEVSWTIGNLPDSDANCNVEINIENAGRKEMVAMRQVDYIEGSSVFEGLEGGQQYEVSVRFMKSFQMDKMTYEYVLAQGKNSYRSVLSKDELDELYQRAEEFGQNDRGHFIHVLYRNKPEPYFREIFQNDGVMYPYMKDYNGDLGCPINGMIKGLFFGGRTNANGSLPPQSPFGDTRFVIPIERLFNEGMNMYFADFYCHTVNHYVTVVLAEPFSHTDDFCNEYLLPLSLHDNPFLKKTFDNRYWLSKKLMVEIFYTLPVNLRFELGYDPRCAMGHTNIYGRGSSKVEGIVKNPNCNICNLYKVKRKRERDDSESSEPSTKRGRDSISDSTKSINVSDADARGNKEEEDTADGESENKSGISSAAAIADRPKVVAKRSTAGKNAIEGDKVLPLNTKAAKDSKDAPNTTIDYGITLDPSFKDMKPSGETPTSSTAGESESSSTKTSSTSEKNTSSPPVGLDSNMNKTSASVAGESDACRNKKVVSVAPTKSAPQKSKMPTLSSKQKKSQNKSSNRVMNNQTRGLLGNRSQGNWNRTQRMSGHYSPRWSNNSNFRGGQFWNMPQQNSWQTNQQFGGFRGQNWQNQDMLVQRQFDMQRQLLHTINFLQTEIETFRNYTSFH